MRILLDTHAFLWWLTDDARLSRRARRMIGDETNDLDVSAASVWEIATKARLGRLPDIGADIAASIIGEGFGQISISVADAERAGRLPGPHRDPFDRMLIAQAMGRDMPILSVDPAFDRYDVRRLW